MTRIIYYEEEAEKYELFKKLSEKFKNDKWIIIKSHNNIAEMQSKDNSEFAAMKNNIIIGIRKTHKYVENNKISDYIVPYTSSGCSAMCLYCYLVCNYNKCSYLRLFVNREEMMSRLMRHASQNSSIYEIGSNSDLVLENTFTDNLTYTIERFASIQKGFLTFPTKFSSINSLLNLAHGGRTIIRVSVNTKEIIDEFEKGTSPLNARLASLVSLYDAGYPVGIIIAPVIFHGDWRCNYEELLRELSLLPERVKTKLPIEIIFMTYSFVHRKINEAAFGVDLYDSTKMTGRGRGRYCYRNEFRNEGTDFFIEKIPKYLPHGQILYFS